MILTDRWGQATGDLFRDTVIKQKDLVYTQGDARILCGKYSSDITSQRLPLYPSRFQTYLVTPPPVVTGWVTRTEGHWPQGMVFSHSGPSEFA